MKKTFVFILLSMLLLLIYFVNRYKNDEVAKRLKSETWVIHRKPVNTDPVPEPIFPIVPPVPDFKDPGDLPLHVFLGGLPTHSGVATEAATIASNFRLAALNLNPIEEVLRNLRELNRNSLATESLEDWQEYLDNKSLELYNAYRAGRMRIWEQKRETFNEFAQEIEEDFGLGSNNLNSRL